MANDQRSWPTAPAPLHDPKAMLVIEPERPEADAEAIRVLHDRAFGTTYESSVVARVRASAAYLPELTLVARDSGLLVGHIMVSRGWLRTPATDLVTLLVAPLSVVPERQRQGIGSALMWRMLERATELGYEHVFLLGHARYYPRFGFRPAAEWGIHPTFRLEGPAVFMGKELVAGSLSGRSGVVRYGSAFWTAPGDR